MTERHPLGKVAAGGGGGGGRDLRESKEAKSTRESMLRDRKKWKSSAFLSNSERADLQSRMALAL